MPEPNRLPALPSPNSALQVARAWADLEPGERKRRAAQAASDRDLDALFQLTAARLALHGRAGGTVSEHTLRSYRQGVSTLLEYVNESGANLLRPPSDDWGHLFARWLEDRGQSPSTVRVRLAAARALYLALRWSSASQADPFGIVKAAVDRTEAHEKCPPYSPEELDRLLEAGNPRDRVAILLGSHAGLRVSEAAGLTWGQVDFDGRQLRVRRGKGRKDRTVDLSATLVAAILELKAAKPPQSSEARLLNLTDHGLQAVMLRLTKRTGVPMRGFHALRHSAGSRLYQETGDLATVADHLGHASLDTARRYAKRSKSLKRTVGSW
jgi:integrase